MLLGFFLFLSVTASPIQANSSPVLNAYQTAGCLAKVTAPPPLAALKTRYRWGRSDLLLLYLGLYSGIRVPHPTIHALQDQAHFLWATRWEMAEGTLALLLAEEAHGAPAGSITLERAFSLTHYFCARSDLFCSSLLLHNTLRTLGRFTTAGRRLPKWFSDDFVPWVVRSAQIHAALMPLSREAETDRWSGWYHFFGIAAYSLRELAVSGDIDTLSAILDINHYGNPFFTLSGSAQDKVGGIRDQEVPGIVLRWLRHLHRPASSRPSRCIPDSYLN